MTSMLRQARKRRFQLREEQRVAQDIELQSYLNQLIIEDADRRLILLKEGEAAAATAIATPTIPASDNSANVENETADDSREEKRSLTEKNLTEPPLDREEIEERKETCMARLNDLFAKVDERRRVSLSFFKDFFNLRKVNCLEIDRRFSLKMVVLASQTHLN